MMFCKDLNHYCYYLFSSFSLSPPLSQMLLGSWGSIAFLMLIMQFGQEKMGWTDPSALGVDCPVFLIIHATSPAGRFRIGRGSFP